LNCDYIWGINSKIQKFSWENTNKTLKAQERIEKQNKIEMIYPNLNLEDLPRFEEDFVPIKIEKKKERKKSFIDLFN
jgi:hypothetical protein